MTCNNEHETPKTYISQRVLRVPFSGSLAVLATSVSIAVIITF